MRRRGGKQDTEHEALVRSIVRLLNLVPGCFAWRNDTGVRPAWNGGGVRAYGTNGASDVMAVYHGKFHAVEVKTGAGRQTEDQMLFAREVDRAGGLYGIARSLADAERIVGVAVFAPNYRPPQSYRG